ncbi:hypothetical protein DM860_006372 [Cuscuta australis]|uniref:Uncharacterized protein n=1 Tax=Cuscuta australis TaxID=267555 RepID=A0A328D3A7_9ASTE|nr:hypothetical protein DM860_006372 [Cuscuta australis]
MATYCQTLRNIADWLDDVDAPVSESQLVLQLLRGLPDDLQAQTSWMQFQQPQPNFLQVRSALLLLERQRLHSIETGTALLAGRTSGQPGTNQQQPHGRTGGVADPAAGRGYPGRGCGRGGQGRGRGRGRNSGGQRHSDGYGSWNSPNQNPNPTPGLLGPRPPPTPTPILLPTSPTPTHPKLPQISPPPATYYPYPTAPLTPVPYPSPLTYPQAPTPTPTALAHNFDTMSLQEPTWLMDTGASHHIASDPGTISHVSSQSLNSLLHITVGNGSKVSTMAVGNHFFPTNPPFIP